MTLQELYQEIGGDYEQALRVLRMDKLLDKHIRKFPKNGVVEAMLDAGASMDPTAMFETSHALKGVSSNLGLTGIADAATVITEDFRPGSSRKLSDAEIQAKLREVEALYRTTSDAIRRYEEA